MEKYSAPMYLFILLVIDCLLKFDFFKIDFIYFYLYRSGRYRKFSRTLCQTPWFIEGDKHMDTSIQELICVHLEPFFKTKGIVSFS